MLIAALDPELYLKSRRTRGRMLRRLEDNLAAALGGRPTITPLAGNRLRVDSDHPEALSILTDTFGIGAVEVAEAADARDLDRLVAAVAAIAGPAVAGRRFAVRPRRLGRHPWRSQDLAVAAGTALVARGGIVDLTDPEVTVSVRVSDDRALVSTAAHPGVGGLPAGTQGRALSLFSGGIDSPVAAWLVARRGVALDHLHFSLGCGQADHAAGIAHLLASRHGAGTDPVFHVIDLAPAAGEILSRTAPRDRTLALKTVMYRVAEAMAARDPAMRALVTGESLGQVSTQTLDNLTALDRLVAIPVLRPLVGLGKQEIADRAAAIGTFDLSARSRELCDIGGGARAAVAATPRRVATIAAALDDLVHAALETAESMPLAAWRPGASLG